MSGNTTNIFPWAYIDVQDKSPRTVPDPTITPLHMPIFVTFAETGPIGEITFGGTNALTAKYGSGFLNQRSRYYFHPNVFIEHALNYQQISMVRVADPAAVAATLVLTCTVHSGAGVAITQYQRTALGAIAYNTSGNPIPQLQADGVTVVTAPGVTLTWAVRAMTATEITNGLNSIATVTTVSGNITSTTYPIAAFQTYVGAAGNTYGFRLFYTTGFESSVVANMNAMTYSFQPVTLNPTTNIESPVYDINNTQTQTFAFKPGAYDTSYDMYYNLSNIITANFTGSKANALPYQFYMYNTNVGLIGNAILAVSPELTGTDPYLINIMSGVDQSDNPYEHVTLNANTTAILNPNVVLYLQGGTDGQVTNSMLEALTVEFFSGELNPLIGDVSRYPITHVYDSGYSLATKQSLPKIFSLRDDVGIDLTTQDVSLPANTAAQDQSTGSALRTAALVNPESIEFGTQTCRVSIFQQCGTLSDTTIYTNIVPASLDRMIKRCIYNGTDHVTGEPKGRPYSEVSVLNIGSVNWTPTSQDQMQLSWSTGLNYLMFCDLAKLFYPDLISVYPIDSSLLSSDVMKDYVIYAKHIVRRVWTVMVGRDDPPKSLFQDIANTIDAACAYAFNGAITTSTVVSQTAVDAASGTQLTVTTTIIGNPTNRVWKVIIPITRAS